jgi:hypothetical protein
MSVRQELILKTHELKMSGEGRNVFFDGPLKTAKYGKRDDQRGDAKGHSDDRNEGNKRNKSPVSA